MISEKNPCGLKGIAFLEYSSNKDFDMEGIFTTFGFSKLAKHKEFDIETFQQNDILFLWNRDGGFAGQFREEHGPSICGMGMFVEDAELAHKAAIAGGARAFDATENTNIPFDLPAIYGIGDSVIYFVDSPEFFFTENFEDHESPVQVDSKGFLMIDHLTNNVQKGTMETWANFYKNVFGFTEVRHFDIRGEKTGLFSYALQSPDKSFCIPINEGTEEKSQIEEYLREYKGAGIQHVAFLSSNLLASLDEMEGSSVEFLDIDDEYYAEVFDRVPNVTEDRDRVKHHNVLVDGDDDGYLLQIFTKNIIGPIFIELIQRKNHYSFGEGNFGALFRSIERDQERRGVL